MAFKALTKKGEEFILNRCLANSAFGNNRFSGKRKFALPKSNNPDTTVYTSAPLDEAGAPILTPEALAKNLISWFNRYSKDYLLDANIIAAQAYAESSYNLWIYSEGGAMGLTQFIDTALYDTVLKNTREFEVEGELLTNGVAGDSTDIRVIIPNYNTRDKTILSTKDTVAVAKTNRAILFQNIINNPRVMIKAQCYIMDFIGERNNNLAASSLFAYNRGGYLRSNSYDDLIDKTQKRYGSEYIKEGVTYVNRIFNLLAGKEPLVPVGFGYDIDFTQADVNYRNISQTVLISGDFPLSQAQEKKVQQLHPVAQDSFRQFIYTVEKNTPFKVQITSGYRTFAEQERIKKENQAMIPPRPASNPGSSYHNYGLALDIAIYSTKVEGLFYSFNKSVAEWKQTGVVAIGEKFGLRWGGDFNDPDQVHFDLGNRYTINECKTLAQNTYGTDPNKVQGNQIPLVA
jgi:hypothetical protein